MSKTSELLDSIKEKAKKSSGNSRSDLNSIVKTMLNDADYEVGYWSADKDGAPVETKHAHVKEFREATADNVARALGLDTDDRNIVRDMPISTKMAESMMDVAIDAEMGYLSTGRKLALPTTDKDSARVGIQFGGQEEKVKETTMIRDGKVVPTGKKVTTFAHNRLKAKNSNYPWQKKSEEI